MITNGVGTMKKLKVFIVIAVLISLGLFSLSYYGGRTDRNKHERALLVFEAQDVKTEAILWERLKAL